MTESLESAISTATGLSQYKARVLATAIEARIDSAVSDHDKLLVQLKLAELAQRQVQIDIAARAMVSAGPERERCREAANASRETITKLMEQFTS